MKSSYSFSGVKDAYRASNTVQSEQMLQDPEDSTYKECYESLPSMIKKRSNKSSVAFEHAMKAAFCKLNDTEDC
jgi:hypothetical protein